MRAAFCDICGKAIDKWFVVDVSIDASDANVDIVDMVEQLGEYDICKECLLELLSTRNKMKERSSGK